MRLTTGPAQSIPGIEHLQRYGETVIDFEYDRGGGGLYVSQQSDQRAVPNFGTKDEQIVGWAPFSGSAQPIDYTSLTGFSARCARILSIAPDIQVGLWPGYANRPLQVQFSDEVMPRLSGVLTDDISRAFVISAILRKYDNVSVVNAQTGFFLVHSGPGSAPAVGAYSDPRVGLFGDGAQGFRFGSIGCPNGIGTYSESAIDAGSVQPSGLVNPGLNFFEVKIKAVPATPAAAAAVHLYLDGTLIVSYSSLTNLPRGRATNAQYNYANINPVFAAFQPAAVPQRNGLYVRMIRYYWTDDMGA